MANIRVQLDLTVPSLPARLIVVGVLLLCVAPELGSESVTLSTYYPAPSGVYTQMITTNNTFLARDGGNVGIGNAAPTQKLDVTGSANVTGNIAVGGNADVTGNANITGNAAVTGSASVAGNVTIGGGAGRGYVLINNTNTGCGQWDVTQGLVCGAGMYATFFPGFYVEGWSFQNRGGRVFAEGIAGVSSYEVSALNRDTNAMQLMTLNKDDSVAHIYCCPKL